MNTNNQIQLITYSSDDVRVSTLEIAKHLLSGSKQKNTTDINRDLVGIIKKHIGGFKQLGLVGFQTRARLSGHHGGGNTEYVELNEPQTNLLFMCMRNSNHIALQFKVLLAKRFDEMKRYIIDRNNAEWLGYRESGKIINKRLNDLFDKALDVSGKPHEFKYFVNLQQSIYKSALGKTFQQLRKERNIPKGEAVRDHLTVKELERINLLQNITELMLSQYDKLTDSMIHTAIHNAGNQLQSIANTKLMIGGVVC